MMKTIKQAIAEWLESNDSVKTTDFENIGVGAESVSKALSKMCRSGELTRERARNPHNNGIMYVYRRSSTPTPSPAPHEWIDRESSIADMTEHIKPWHVKIDGTWAAYPDPHSPFIHKAGRGVFVHNCIEHNVETIVIPGDAFDCYCLSGFYDALPVKMDFTTECENNRMFISYLFYSIPCLKKIYICAGNHEMRIRKRTEGRMGINEVMQLCVGDELLRMKKVEYSPLNNIIVNNKWLLVHPNKARKIPLSNARELSQKYPDYHIIVSHQHTVAEGKNASGKRFLIDVGCMTDPGMHSYTQDANNFNKHQLSFLIVKGDKYLHIGEDSLLWV